MTEGVGIEIGNGRIKIAAGAGGCLRARAYPVAARAGAPRGSDIAEAFPAALAAFAAETGVDCGGAPAVVAFSSQFAYPSFQSALVETVAMLRRNGLGGARLAGADRLYDLATGEALAERPEGALWFAAARMAGIRALARSQGAFTLAIDCGTTSTEIVPLAASAADWPNEGRLTDGRLVWIGLLETPIDYVAREAAGYAVVPRVARMAAVTGYLGLAGPAVAATAAERATLAAELAQGVGLDAFILADDEIERIARSLRESAVGQIAAAALRVLARMGGTDRPSAAVLGIGKAALATPALAACGIRDPVDLEAAIGVPPNFGAVAGLALLAADRGVDEPYAGDQTRAGDRHRLLAGRRRARV
ncbi:MAG: hypothetical protein FJZ01_25115 [Candidatus Sericytochromatia bacterium]|nr:hypothetical protein [Candidatus Tanganyikabacteria bacterium]